MKLIKRIYCMKLQSGEREKNSITSRPRPGLAVSMMLWGDARAYLHRRRRLIALRVEACESIEMEN